MKQRTGYVYQEKITGAWYARICYTKNNGKRSSIKRRAKTKTEARLLLKQILETFEDGGQKAFDAEKLTLNDLCDYFEKHYCKPPKYVAGRKVAGMRSHITVSGYVAVFREYFGRKHLKSLTYEDLCHYRLERLTTSTHQSEQRSIATVNRELAYLRRILNIAERSGMIAKNPFRCGDALIHAADELKRERIISRDEETRLIAACEGARKHLRPIVVAALDTGCRLGELLKLSWKDIDREAGIITIQALNTKTLRERKIAITSRLALELEELWRTSGEDENELIFGIKSTIRQAFRKACDQVGLDDLRMHDLRHSHATRLDDLGFSLAKIGAQLGHTQVQTTLRYVNRDKDAVKQVAAALDALNSDARDPKTQTSEFIN